MIGVVEDEVDVDRDDLRDPSSLSSLFVFTPEYMALKTVLICSLLFLLLLILLRYRPHHCHSKNEFLKVYLYLLSLTYSC